MFSLICNSGQTILQSYKIQASVIVQHFASIVILNIKTYKAIVSFLGTEIIHMQYLS